MSPARSAFCAVLSTVLTLSPAGAETEFKRQQLPKGHPAVGAWRIELPQIDCFERIDIRADGTRSVISGKEIAQAEFSISPGPDQRGFYSWSDRITSTNGEPDCAGIRTVPGVVSLAFMVFAEDKNSFFLCPDPDSKACIGPYVKLAGIDS